jgi:hypothetical protein
MRRLATSIYPCSYIRLFNSMLENIAYVKSVKQLGVGVDTGINSYANP